VLPDEAWGVYVVTPLLFVTPPPLTEVLPDGWDALEAPGV
jgi:hypothetical protein